MSESDVKDSSSQQNVATVATVTADAKAENDTVSEDFEVVKIVRVSSSGGGGGGGGGGGWGGKLPPQNTQLPPQREREKEEMRKRRERERERKRERCMVWERERVHFCVALQVISIVSYFMTQLFKSTR